MSFPESANGKIQEGLRPIDIATLFYVILEMAIIVIFMTHWRGWYFAFGFYVVALGMVLMFTVFPMPSPPVWWKVLRIIYPAILVSIFYEALRSQIFLIHGNSFDAQILGFEKGILGYDLYFVLQRHMTIALNELFSLSYMSYYILLPLALFLLIFKRRWQTLERMVLACGTAFYACFIIFILYPVVGPRFYLQSEFYLPIIGPLFTPLAHMIVAGGGLHGAAMPSSHCAIALTAVVFLTREFKGKTIPLWVVLVLLCCATVYGRYHYFTDVIVGLTIGTLSIILTSYWQNRFLMGKRELAGIPDFECGEPIETGIGK